MSDDSRNFTSEAAAMNNAVVEPNAGASTIPHHAAVETAAEGARLGRIFFGTLAEPSGH